MNCPAPTTTNLGELVPISDTELDFFFPTEDTVRGLVALTAKLGEYERHNRSRVITDIRVRFEWMTWHNPVSGERHDGRAYRALIIHRAKTSQEIAHDVL
ncbi:MAG: hypothetical protein HYZ07_02725 [Candidatus Harrisonbacteria bacterium]|nr:hypothetical protein [Candidatus Harrisonbacteria bacterium]MBI2406372.1 hypothetical protein [Candidatus Harrisonbacteria bacterium]MBI2603985.1 hypothetical protein [Candidatus Harrisonbacteria bacterium]MBI3114851.1 hypothetical protein [Candidatus Harrisonbacteria bacterium]